MFDESIGIYQVQVTHETSPIQKDIQADIFSEQLEHNNCLRVVDDINKRFAEKILLGQRP